MRYEKQGDSAKLFALESLLELHFSNQQLIGNPSRNKIHREIYLSEVRLPSRSEESDRLFDRYDRLALEVEKVDDHLISALDTYIEQAIAQRTLAIQSGRIIRVRVGDLLGLTPLQLKHTSIVSRLHHWDDEISKLVYSPDTRAITRENASRAASPPKRLSAFRVKTISERGGNQTTTGKLEAVLAEHRRTNSFIRNASGRFASGEYAKLIGNKKEEMTPAHRRILLNYEREAGPILTVTERKIPAIKAWFRSGVTQRTLPSTSGKIQELALMKRFCISRKQLAACQPLRQVIIDLNKELASIDYRPKEPFELETLLLKTLSKAKLHKSGLSIDRLDLARKLGCTPTRLSRPPLAALVEAADLAHCERIAKDPVWVCFPERAIDYGPLVALGYSEEVVHRVCTAFKATFLGQLKERRMRVGAAVFTFFRRVAQLPIRCVRAAFNAVNRRTPISEDEWRMALVEVGRGATANLTNYFNAIIECFSNAGC